MTVEPFPIAARWRKVYRARDYAFYTMTPKDRKVYLDKIVTDHTEYLIKAQVAPEKIKSEISDLKRMLRKPPNNDGTRMRATA